MNVGFHILDAVLIQYSAKVSPNRACSCGWYLKTYQLKYQEDRVHDGSLMKCCHIDCSAFVCNRGSQSIVSFMSHSPSDICQKEISFLLGREPRWWEPPRACPTFPVLLIFGYITGSWRRQMTDKVRVQTDEYIRKKLFLNYQYFISALFVKDR